MDKLLKQVKHMEGHYNVTRKKAQQWYSVDDEKKLLSFCIQDRKKHKDGSINNEIDFKKGIVEACIGSNEYIYNRFIKKVREKYAVRIFIKKVNESLFDEVRCVRWSCLEDRIQFYFDTEE